MRTKVKVKVDMKGLNIAPEVVSKIRYQSVQDVGQSLAMTASGAAPHDQGTLDSSTKVKPQDGSFSSSVEVAFLATRKGFDYAKVMHDGIYKLGPKSQAKPGGQGMSGRNYRVGPKFLLRTLEGEKEAYANYINQKIQTAIAALSK